MSVNESFKRCRVVDFSKCVVCQEETGDDLTDPQKCTRSNNESYNILASNLENFDRLGVLPAGIDLNALRGSTTLAQSFTDNRAVWHKQCYMSYSKSRLERAASRIGKENCPPTSSPPTTRRSLGGIGTERTDTCAFCSKVGTRNHPLSAVEFPEKWNVIINQAALEKDKRLLNILDGGHGLKNVVYHKKCRTGYLNKARAKESHQPAESSQKDGVVLAKLYGHMTEVRRQSDSPPVFKMADLARLYCTEMAQMGVKSDVHSTRLRERLLQECPALEHIGKKGQDVLIGFKKDVDTSIREELRDFDGEAFHFAKVAKIIRKDVFSSDSDENSERKVPLSLKTLIQMILNGPTLSSLDLEENAEQVVTSVAENIAFQIRKKTGRSAGTVRRHSKKQETATPVYVATKLYGATRKKGLIDIFYQLGLSISYDRLDNMLDAKAQEVADLYMQEGVVCPKDVRCGVFTTAAVDNIDHNPSSTTAQGSFHGTAITLMQHISPESQG